MSRPPATRRALRRTRRMIGDGFHRFIASDPGLTRLRSAFHAAASVGIAILAEWLFFRTVLPLTLPASDPQATVHNQAVQVMAIMAGAMVAMVASFVGPSFSRVRTGLAGLVLLPLAMLAGITVGLLVAPVAPLALVTMVVVLGASGFLRRFKAWGFTIGQGMFMGNFLGFFLHRITDLTGLGWVAAELGIGTAVAILAYLAIYVPSQWSAVKRLRVSFLSRADGVAAATIDMLDAGGTLKSRRRQHQQLVRFNETALMIDAQLAESTRLPVGMTAADLHQQVFSAELSLANAARFVRTLCQADVNAETAARLRAAMVAVQSRDTDRVRDLGKSLRAWLNTHPDDGSEHRIVLHRFATSVIDYADALAVLHRQQFVPYREWLRASAPAGDPLETSVSLSSGWLPGSSTVSATASKEQAAQPRWTRMEPSTRVGIQMLVAGTIAVIAGSLINAEHFYWAVIAAFVTFMGANNAGEQIRKGAFRVIGTVAGVLLGFVLAELVGARVGLSIAVILITLFVGIYLMRVSYVFFVTALTVLVAQLYVQLNELSAGLLELRLLETVIGVAAAVVTVIFVFPLRTGRVVRVATREFVEAVAELVGPSILLLRDADYIESKRAATRQLDAAFQSLAAATAPRRAAIRVPGTLGGVDHRWWAAANAVHSYARDLVADNRLTTPMRGELEDQLAEAGQLMIASIHQLSRGLTEHATTRVYTRSAPSFEAVAASLEDRNRVTPRQLTLKDLQLIDGALAALAESAGVSVADSITDSEATTRPRSERDPRSPQP